MTDHPTLDFTSSPTPARATDPQTSHDAGRSVKASALPPVRRWLLVHLLVAPELQGVWACSHEGIARHFANSGLQASSSGLRTRLSELRHAGLVRDSGIKVRMHSTGRLAVVWELTDLGIAAAEEPT